MIFNQLKKGVSPNIEDVSIYAKTVYNAHQRLTRMLKPLGRIACLKY